MTDEEDTADEDPLNGEQQQPGPKHSADETTQQDAGLDGGTAGARREERVGDEEE